MAGQPETSLSPAFALGSLAGSLSAPNLDEAFAHFAPEACLIDASGRNLRGEAITISLAKLIEGRPLVCIDQVEVAEAGDLASVIMRWSGHRVAEAPPRRLWATRASAVLRRSAAHWQIAVLAPWGDHRAAPEARIIAAANENPG